MKKLYILFLLTALPFTGFGQTTIASYTFDTDEEGWVAGASAAVAYDAANYYTSSGSLKLILSATNKVGKVNFTITEIGEYTVTYKIKSLDGASKTKAIINQGSNDAGTLYLISDLTSSLGADGDTWYEYTHTFTLPTLASPQLQIQGNAIDTYYIDDVTIVKEPLAGNILTVNTVGAGSVAKTLDKISYDPTDVETLTATAATHWNFDSWSEDLTGSTNPETLLMDADKTVTANFSVNPAFDYDFTFDTDGDIEGWETDPQLTVSTHTGGLVTLTPTANQWARFSLFDFPIPTASYNRVEITLKNESTDDDEITVIVINGTATVVLTPQTMTTGDTGFKTYGFNLNEASNWTGDADSVRIRFSNADNDPIGRSSGTGNIIIDNIVFNNLSTLSVNDIDFKDDASILIYPNPVQNTLKINASKDITKIEVYNILGQKMLSKKNSSSIDVSTLNKGVYITKIFQENDVISTKRFIKE